MTAIYKEITKFITVKEVAEPFVLKCEPSTTLREVIALYNIFNRGYYEYCFFVNNKGAYGFIALENIMDSLEYDQCIDDFIIPITTELVISDTTPLIRMPSLFVNSEIFFILTDEKISQFVTYWHLENLPMRLALFARILELDDNINNYLLRVPKPEEFINAVQKLSQNRIRTIKKIHETKYFKTRKLTPSKFLTYLNFSDKKVVFQSFPEFLTCFPFETSEDIDQFFTKLVMLRNRIAHNDQILPVFNNPTGFYDFVVDLDQTIDLIAEFSMKQCI